MPSGDNAVPRSWPGPPLHTGSSWAITPSRKPEVPPGASEGRPGTLLADRLVCYSRRMAPRSGSEVAHQSSPGLGSTEIQSQRPVGVSSYHCGSGSHRYSSPSRFQLMRSCDSAKKIACTPFRLSQKFMTNFLPTAATLNRCPVASRRPP